MSSIIDVPEVRAAVQPMSVAFYHEAGRLGWLDESVELLEGYPVKKMSKSPLHEFIGGRLRRLIQKVVPQNCFVAKERPLTCSHSEPEPDLMVVEGEEDDFFDHHPTTAKLLIEVAISTVAKDHRKAAIYAEAGVDEYWLINGETPKITVHRRPSPKGYSEITEFEEDQTVSSMEVPGLSVTVSELFARP